MSTADAPTPADLADAAVIQIAASAIDAAAKYDDPRLKAIAETCQVQLRQGDTINTLLRMLAIQTSGPTPDQRRDEQREKFQEQWQQSLRERMASSSEHHKRASELNIALAEKLLGQIKQAYPQSETNDDRRTTTSADSNVGRPDPTPKTTTP